VTDEATLPGHAEATAPGQSTAPSIAAWAESRRAAGEFPAGQAPRSVRDGAVVELREVDRDNVREICALQVAPDQRPFVAPNAVSLAEAIFAPLAWFRATYADDVAVGFAMLSLDVEKAEYFLWRLMIDAAHQGRGYGREAMALIVDHVRSLPSARELLVSWVPGEAGPEPFYRGLGFVPTGEVDGSEIAARLELGS
jgi:diamine N-acetyltransferase